MLRLNKSLLTAYLEDAFERGICPICHLRGETEYRSLDMFLYERVNDISARRDIARSKGFCVYHTYRMLEVGGFGSHAKIAMIYKSVVDALVDEVALLDEKRAAHVDMDANCPICRTVAQTERSYVEVLANMLRHESVRPKYAQSAGLCMRHYYQVYDLSKPGVRLFLKQDQSRRLASLSDDLGEFIRKSVIKTEPFGEEKDSWIRVIRLCAGTLKSATECPGGNG
ncbi:MAG: hypothetical protein GX552_08375 [Chloroflexi bacterium]|jgi:hypothetical protein|nr:hypothetical protein [Chloroflexota bacterium]